jgi:hypothetical protein
MSDEPRNSRGGLMRRMAAIQSRIDSLERIANGGDENKEKQAELRQQIADLWLKILK